jgi:hypothetical protein
MRIASHKRFYEKFGQFSTLRDHMPDNHKIYVDQTPENVKEWAKGIGKNTAIVTEYLLQKSQNEKWH